MADPLLEVAGLSASHGSVRALSEVSFELHRGELLLLVGPNGAGKSTLMRVLLGLHPADAGTVRFEGRDVTSLPVAARAKLGMAWVPEGRGVIAQLSVQENLDLARFSPAWRPELRERTFERFPMLRGFLRRPAGTLSGGEQQMLAVGRALETDAKVLLVDEPSLGLAPMVVDMIIGVLGDLRDEGRTILLVEQRAAQVGQIATRTYLMRHGAIVDREGHAEFTEIDFSEYAGTTGGGDA